MKPRAFLMITLSSEGLYKNGIHDERTIPIVNTDSAMTNPTVALLCLSHYPASQGPEGGFWRSSSELS
jgi:hypothetical protein